MNVMLRGSRVVVGLGLGSLMVATGCSSRASAETSGLDCSTVESVPFNPGQAAGLGPPEALVVVGLDHTASDRAQFDVFVEQLETVIAPQVIAHHAKTVGLFINESSSTNPEVLFDVDTAAYLDQAHGNEFVRTELACSITGWLTDQVRSAYQRSEPANRSDPASVLRLAGELRSQNPKVPMVIVLLGDLWATSEACNFDVLDLNAQATLFDRCVTPVVGSRRFDATRFVLGGVAADGDGQLGDLDPVSAVQAVEFWQFALTQLGAEELCVGTVLSCGKEWFE